MSEMNFECGYCHRQFTREGAFMKHECKTMIRAREIHTIPGQMAYGFYVKWMKAMDRKCPTIQVFSTSKYYTTFMKFAKFVTTVNLVDVDLYITTMTEKQLQPSTWTLNAAYVYYLEYLDKAVDPMDRVEYMIKELHDLAEDKSCEMSVVLDNMTPNECLDLIRSRTFTGWLLLNMRQFRTLVKRCNSEQKTLFESVMRPAYWHGMFKQRPDIVKAVQQIVKTFDL